MKRIIFILTALLGLGFFAGAAVASTGAVDIIPGVKISNLAIDREGKFLSVAMNLDLRDLKVGSNRAVLLTPRLVNGNDSVDLPAVGIYGRTRYLYYVRNGISSLSGDNETVLRSSQKPDTLGYDALTTFQNWMDGATLRIHRCDWGCCHKILAEYDGALGSHSEAFFPQLTFVKPQAEVMKSRSLSGSAFIDFPVDQTVIYPDYRRNTVELAKIKATIDSVRNDRDVTITSVWLKGFASPGSPYKHNAELAIGRTDALRRHINSLYHFADGVIATDYEPEDWAGLRRAVEQSNLPNSTQILEMIDSDMEPDAKEAAIRRAFPDDYRFMLDHFYPALRHTDYRIDYTIRTFTSADEIRRIMEEQPQKLSLNEFYLVAQSYEPGTPEFTDVFETAVRMFPDDEVANLNAANAAIRRDDFTDARRYLAKAGDSAEAVYTRGALAVREKKYPEAIALFGKAAAMGLPIAQSTLDELNSRLGK